MFRIKFAAAFAALLAIVVALPGITATPSTASAAQSIPGAYIVVLKDGADADAEAGKAAKDHGAIIDHVYTHALNGYAFRGSAKAAAALAKNPNVDFVSPDGVVEAIGKPGDGPSIAAQQLPTGVQRIGATGLANKGATVGVAVIDTGIDLTHPDLTGVVNGKTCVPRTSTANDDNGHGTHVAGTIGARDNEFGAIGVAPAVTLYAVKVLNSRGSGTWSQVICGINWVANPANNIKVANMSLGGGGSNDNNCGNSNNDAMHKAICKATANGVTFVVAAGNSGANLDTAVPAAYPEVLTVTAISDSNGQGGGGGGAPACSTSQGDDVPATFSNYAVTGGALNHTIAAPGVCIYSTWKGGSYNTISGTSMASPHVAGVVALCIARAQAVGGCKDMAPAQVIQELRNDAAAKNLDQAYGFAGDPNSSPSAKAYGYLAWAGGY